MTNLIPMNATEANKMANAWTKAQNLIADGYKFILCTDTESPVTLVAVYKPEDAANAPSYFIRKGFTAPELPNGCNCPAFAQNGHRFCKHTFCWEEIQLNEAAILAYFAEEENAECANGVDSLL